VKVIGNLGKQEAGRWLNNGAAIYICLFDDETGRCCVFDACEQHRHTSPFTLLPATISNANAISIAEKFQA
jgi:hypothetical protein